MAKTGRLLISHEAPVTGGFASEISSTVQVSVMNLNWDLLTPQKGGWSFTGGGGGGHEVKINSHQTWLLKELIIVMWKRLMAIENVLLLALVRRKVVLQFIIIKYAREHNKARQQFPSQPP